MVNNYCSKCGEKIDSKAKYCSKCGEKITNNQEFEKEITEQEKKTYASKLECPYCKSHNVNTQVVTENKKTGCLMIFIYIILALTIIGIPIMIIILLAKGKKTSSRTVYVCQNCGRTFNKSDNTNVKNVKKNKKLIIVASILVPIALLCIILDSVIENSEVKVPKSEYVKLNPQTLYNDYIDNELSADDKYKGNYYYITGKISDIEHFLNDNYLEIQFDSTRDKTQIIEITAYFNDIDELKEVKKGDTVTVYGQFHQRSIEDYANITVFSLENCHLNVED